MRSLARRLEHTQRRERLQAISELRRLQEGAASLLLIYALKHGDAVTRWWAVAALRGRKDPRVLAALRRALKDRSVAVRLNACKALGVVGDIQARVQLEARLKDRSSLVRAAAAQALGQLADKRSLKPLSLLLDDLAEPVRRAAAQAILRRAMKAPSRLQKRARLILRTRRRISHFVSKPLSYTPRTLKSRLYLIPRCLRRLKYRFRRARRYGDDEGLACLEKQKKEINTLSTQLHKRLQQWKKAYREADASAQGHLARFLLAWRRLRAQCRQISRCRLRYRRGPISFFRRGVHFESLPDHYHSRHRNYFALALDVAYDTYPLALRDDYVLKQIEQDGYLAGYLNTSYNLRISRELELYLKNRLGYLFFFNHRLLSGIDEIFQAQLTFARKKRRWQYLLFVQDELGYLQNPPGEEGFPDAYSGRCFQNRLRLGGGWGWRKRRSEGQFLGEYINYFAFADELEEVAPQKVHRMYHIWRLGYYSHISRWLRWGIFGRFQWYHPLADSKKLPVFQLGVPRLDIEIGRRDQFYVKGGVGLGVLVLFLEDQTADLLAPTGEAGIFWSGKHTGIALRYRYRLAAAARPGFTHFFVHEANAEFRLGRHSLKNPKRRTRKRIYFRVGALLQWVQYFKGDQLPGSEEAKKAFESVRFGLYIHFEYPIVRWLWVVAGDQLEVLRDDNRLLGETVVRNRVYGRVELRFQE